MACGCGKDAQRYAAEAGKQVAQILHGAGGLAKVAAQAVGIPIDKIPYAYTKLRRDVCRACPHASKSPDRLDRPSKGLTTLSKCELCGCFIAAKTMLASEKCPAEPPKW
jgi:hypothetical protein